MIVVSAALVVVAVLLLVLGLAAGLAFVYASIVASLLAVGALAVGVVQRHTGARDGGGGAAAPWAPGAGPPPAAARPGASPAVPETDPPGAREAGGEDAGHVRPATPGPGDGLAEPVPVVHVVAGRPRYHLPECRYLQGRDAEQLPAGQARARGFTPCGICHPERALGPAATAGPVPVPDGWEAESARPAASVVVPSADGQLHRPTCSLVVGALATEARTRDEAVGDGSSPCPLCRP